VTETTARRPSPRGLILGLILAGVLMSSFYPARRFMALRGETRAQEAVEAALDERIAALTDEAALLSSDAEVERLARDQLGMVRPGEVPFVMARPDRVTTDPVVESPAPTDPPSSRPVVSAWLEAAARALGFG